MRYARRVGQAFSRQGFSIDREPRPVVLAIAMDSSPPFPLRDKE